MIVVISFLAALALYLSGTPLVSLISSQTDSSPDGSSMTDSQFRVHWPLVSVCAAGVVGLVTAAWPQRRPPRLQS